MKDRRSSHSELKCSPIAPPTTAQMQSRMPGQLVAIVSAVRMGRAPSLSDGPPTRVVASPSTMWTASTPAAAMRSAGVPKPFSGKPEATSAARRRCRIAISGIIEPTCSDGAVRSNPT